MISLFYCSGSYHAVFNNNCVRPETKTINRGPVHRARDQDQSRGARVAKRGTPNIRLKAEIVIRQIVQWRSIIEGYTAACQEDVKHSEGQSDQAGDCLLPVTVKIKSPNVVNSQSSEFV